MRAPVTILPDDADDDDDDDIDTSFPEDPKPEVSKSRNEADTDMGSPEVQEPRNATEDSHLTEVQGPHDEEDTDVGRPDFQEPRDEEEDLDSTRDQDSEDEEAALATVGTIPACSQEPTALRRFVPPARNGNPWALKLSDSFYLCGRHTWETEMHKRSALDGSSLNSWIPVASAVLASIPGFILDEIVGGNIAREANTRGSDVRETLSFYEINCPPEGTGRPGIYVVTLVDLDGFAPTPDDMTTIAREMNTKALRIKDVDRSSRMLARQEEARWNASSYKNKGRRFLASKPTPSDDMRAKISLFTRKVLENMAPLEDRDEPMDRPLQYFGYSKNPMERIQAHLDHSGSSYIMSLAESVSFNLWMKGEVTQEYMLQGFPICFVSQAEDAIAAEILLSCIGDGYIENGRGLAHTGAGQSNHSVNDYTEKQWGQFAKWVRARTPILPNLKLENERLEAKKQLWLLLRQEEELRNDPSLETGSIDVAKAKKKVQKLSAKAGAMVASAAEPLSKMDIKATEDAMMTFMSTGLGKVPVLLDEED